MVGPKIDGIGAKLDRPFDVATAGFLIVENVIEWVLHDYRYVVGIEVVAELPGCDKDGPVYFISEVLNESKTRYL